MEVIRKVVYNLELRIISKASINYSYYGDAYQVKEASGTFRYTDVNNILLESFGAKKN